jgi:hypothetical protein
MVKAVEYAVRNPAGAVARGGVAGDGGGSFLQLAAGEQVSLNLAQAHVLGYEREGANLIVRLIDGREIVLAGFFDAPGAPNRLFLSSEGQIAEVTLAGGAGGTLVPGYGAAEGWGKFSALDDLRFDRGETLVMAAGTGEDDPAGMAAFVPGLMGLGGGLLPAAAIVGGGVLIAGGGGGNDGDDDGPGGDDGDDDDQGDDDGEGDGDDDDDDGDGGGDGDGPGDGDGDGDDDGDDGDDDGDGGDDDGDDDGDGDGDDDGDDDDNDDHDDNDRRDPTVDGPDDTQTVTTNTPDPRLVVTGTGEPGDTVSVVIGDETRTTTIGEDATWGVTFPGDGLPDDGTHPAVVTVTPPGGTAIVLDGPTFIIDLTPPAVAFGFGTEGTGDIENADGHADGVTVGGTGEPGATLVVTCAGAEHAATVAADGTWQVTFTPAELPGGEYAEAITVVATDALGNTTTIADRVVIDTVPHPLSIDPVTADNTVNGAEAAAEVTIGGTSTPGATISVAVAGQTLTATAGATGAWAVTWPAGAIAAGEYDATVTASTVDAAGNPSSTTRTFRVDTVTSVALDTPVAGDDTVNAAEAAGGLVLTGTAQAGAALSVAWNGVTLPATAGADGRWTASFPGSSFAAGEYDTTVTVTATDAAGNTATTAHPVRVDTLTAVSVDPGQAGGDNIVSGAERSAAGLVLTGRAEPGAAVAVTFEGVTRSVTADASGAWSAAWTAAEVPPGTYATTVTVTATDRAGNTATAAHALQVDTEVRDFAATGDSTGPDGVLNAAEAAAGLTVTGTVEPGSTVMVSFGADAARPATVAPDGTWSVTIPPGAIAPGERDVTLTATATDRVGNTATLTETVRVDTLVTPFTRAGGPIGGDGVLNGAEVQAGLPLHGTVEPGATVTVRLSNGAEKTALATPEGTWSVAFAPADLPRGETAVTARITATDLAGNTATLTERFAVDTVAPGAPEVVSFTRDAAGLRGIGTEATTDAYAFTSIDAAGNRQSIAATRSDDPAFGETDFRFGAPVPDGSYLVIDTTDTAGNQSSTLLIVDNTNAPTVNLDRAGLSAFDFTAIDLTFAPDARMTITEAQLRDLTGPDARLVVKGGADDTVTVADAAATGATEMIDGERYSVYTLGTSGATLLLDDDIRTTI